jgi:hypothetical protein
MEDKMDIRHIKFINGDEIIALVSRNNDDNMLVERPCAVKANMIGTYNLSPYFPFSSSTLFKFLKNRVLCSVKVDDSLKQKYLGYVLQMRAPTGELLAGESEMLQQYQDVLKEYATQVAEDEDYYYEEDEPVTPAKKILH